MPKIPISLIVSFSSQCMQHPLENILANKSGKKWLSAPNDRTGKLWAIFQLPRPTKITNLDIGTYFAFSVEVLVGRSNWAQTEEYRTLVPMITLMNVTDCRMNKNTVSMKMLKYDNFDITTRDQEWDRIKIVLSQPFRRDVQFGLSTLVVTSTESDPRETDDIDTSFPKERASPLPSYKSIRKSFPLADIKRDTKTEAVKAKILKISGSAENGSSNEASLSRAAQLILASAGKTPKYKQQDAIGVKPMTTSDGRKMKIPFEKELEMFHKSLDLSTLDLEKTKFADLRHSFEKLKWRKLSKEEKKVFRERTSDYINEMVNSGKLLGPSDENRAQPAKQASHGTGASPQGQPTGTRKCDANVSNSGVSKGQVRQSGVDQTPSGGSQAPKLQSLPRTDVRTNTDEGRVRTVRPKFIFERTAEGAEKCNSPAPSIPNPGIPIYQTSVKAKNQSVSQTAPGSSPARQQVARIQPYTNGSPPINRVISRDVRGNARAVESASLSKSPVQSIPIPGMSSFSAPGKASNQDWRLISFARGSHPLCRQAETIQPNANRTTRSYEVMTTDHCRHPGAVEAVSKRSVTSKPTTSTDHATEGEFTNPNRVVKATKGKAGPKSISKSTAASQKSDLNDSIEATKGKKKRKRKKTKSTSNLSEFSQDWSPVKEVKKADWQNARTKSDRAELINKMRQRLALAENSLNNTTGSTSPSPGPPNKRRKVGENSNPYPMTSTPLPNKPCFPGENLGSPSALTPGISERNNKYVNRADAMHTENTESEWLLKLSMSGDEDDLPDILSGRPKTEERTYSQAGPSSSIPTIPKKKVQCPICSGMFSEEVIQFHSMTCENASDDDEDMPAFCPFCSGIFTTKNINAHANVCLDSGGQ